MDYELYEDCVNQIQKIFVYDEKVIRGLIVQVFYQLSRIVPTINRSKDMFLKSMAEYCRGELSEVGIGKGRRDMDFIFSDVENANAFKRLLQAHNQEYFIHDKLNVMGDLVDKPSLDSIVHKRDYLKKLNCKNPEEWKEELQMLQDYRNVSAENLTCCRPPGIN